MDDREYLLSLLEPAPDDVLDMYAISTRVNNVRNDGPDLIAPVDAEEALALPLPYLPRRRAE